MKTSTKIIIAISISSIVVFLLFMFQIPEEQNSLKNSNLKGKIQSIQVSTYSLIENSGDFQKNGLDSRYKSQFNKDGNIVEYRKYNTGLSLDKRIKYS